MTLLETKSAHCAKDVLHSSVRLAWIGPSVGTWVATFFCAQLAANGQRRRERHRGGGSWAERATTTFLAVALSAQTRIARLHRSAPCVDVRVGVFSLRFAAVQRTHRTKRQRVLRNEIFDLPSCNVMRDKPRHSLRVKNVTAHAQSKKMETVTVLICSFSRPRVSSRRLPPALITAISSCAPWRRIPQSRGTSGSNTSRDPPPACPER